MNLLKKIIYKLFPRRQGLIKLSFRQSFPMIRNYSLAKIKPQFKSVFIVSVFLAAIQYFVLGEALIDAIIIAICVGAAILGLSFFLEGLFLGIMPLGEQCGMRLPAKIGAAGMAVFSIVVGITATLAEPAIAVLQQQGSVIPAWNAPLLFLLLNRGTSWLVAAIAAGVGISVVIGVYRFMFGWPFKPPVFVIIPLLLVLSFLFDKNPVLRPLVNLAWDTGGAATGAVTVPIILALGLGAAKIGGKRTNNSGLGVVTLASALPAASVLLLAAFIAPRVPDPGSAASFFSAEEKQREKAVYVAGSSDKLIELAENAVYSGDMTSWDFFICFPDGVLSGEKAQEDVSVFSRQLLLEFLNTALYAVLPLSLALFLAIIIFARDRLYNIDVVFLGIIFTIIGMFALNLGMKGGITALSSQAGNSLKLTYTESFRLEDAVILKGVDSSSFITVPGENGAETYIWVPGEKGPTPERFMEDQLLGNQYHYVPVKNPVISDFGVVGGYLLVLIIVFFLGFLAIFAEPGLAVTAVTVEDMTTGTFKRSKLIILAATGVGIGMAIGFARVLFSNLLPTGGIHLSWILLPSYGLALFLTIFAPEDFSSIAWDTAGIATGPIAVPIMITAGLGLGRDSLRADGAFGIVAMASVFPIIVILISGIIDKAKSKRAIKN